MKKIMLIGRTGSGKTTLTQILKKEIIEYKKTQSINYYENIIDTPGEYIENKAYYRALIVSAAECDIVAFVHNALDNEIVFPPNFSEIFNKPTIGIITKIDLVENFEKARNLLEEIGIKKIIGVSAKTLKGIEDIKHIIKEW
ncbi:MAG: EutP/PduV family microcompartment system protein [Fusobacteriaceae bacterium]